MPRCPVPEALKVEAGFALMSSSSSLALLYGDSVRTINPPASALMIAATVKSFGWIGASFCQCIMVISTVARPHV
jgi:hypothetical protein